jgi:phage shock protein C
LRPKSFLSTDQTATFAHSYLYANQDQMPALIPKLPAAAGKDGLRISAGKPGAHDPRRRTPLSMPKKRANRQRCDYMEKRLCLSTTNKILTGVCGGFASYFGVDATLIRMLWVMVFVLFFGVIPAILYILCWAIMPLPKE